MVGSVIYSRGRDEDGYGRLDNDDKHDKVSFSSDGSWAAKRYKRKDCCCFIILIICVLLLFFAFVAFVVYEQNVHKSDAKLIKDLQDRISVQEDRLNNTVHQQSRINSNVNQNKIDISGMRDSLSILPDEIAKDATSFKASINQSLSSLTDSLSSQKGLLNQVQTKQSSFQQKLIQNQDRLERVEGKVNNEQQRLNVTVTDIHNLDAKTNMSNDKILGLALDLVRYQQAMEANTAYLRQHLNNTVKNAGNQFYAYLEDFIQEVTLFKTKLNQSISQLSDKIVMEQQRMNETRMNMESMRLELIASIEDATREYRYEIIAKTGSDSAADSSADIFLILKGTKGQCGAYELTHNTREGGEQRTEVLCEKNIGTITGVNIRHSGTDAWEMIWMTIQDLNTSALYRITCQSSCWFDDDGHEGGVETRDLSVD